MRLLVILERDPTHVYVTWLRESCWAQALTVSPSYAKEITMDPEKGVELEALFKMGNCTGLQGTVASRRPGAHPVLRSCSRPGGILNGVKEGVSPSDMNFVTKTMMTCGPFTAWIPAAFADGVNATRLASVPFC